MNNDKTVNTLQMITQFVHRFFCLLFSRLLLIEQQPRNAASDNH